GGGGRWGGGGRPGTGPRPARPPPAEVTGATVSPWAYGITSWVQAAKRFDSYVRLPLATTIQKIYMREGEYYTGPVAVRIASLARAGCQFIICVYPSRTTDERAKLAGFFRLLRSKGIVYQAALVNEWNTGTNFADAQ